MKLKISSSGVVLELTADTPDAMSDGLDCLLARTEGIRRLLEALDALGDDDEDDSDDDTQPDDPGDDGGHGVDVDALLTQAGITG